MVCGVCVVELLNGARYDGVFSERLVCGNPETNTELR